MLCGSSLKPIKHSPVQHGLHALQEPAEKLLTQHSDPEDFSDGMLEGSGSWRLESLFSCSSTSSSQGFLFFYRLIDARGQVDVNLWAASGQ